MITTACIYLHDNLDGETLMERSLSQWNLLKGLPETAVEDCRMWFSA